MTERFGTAISVLRDRLEIAQSSAAHCLEQARRFEELAQQQRTTAVGLQVEIGDLKTALATLDTQVAAGRLQAAGAP